MIKCINQLSYLTRVKEYFYKRVVRYYILNFYNWYWESEIHEFFSLDLSEILGPNKSYARNRVVRGGGKNGEQRVGTSSY